MRDNSIDENFVTPAPINVGFFPHLVRPSVATAATKASNLKIKICHKNCVRGVACQNNFLDQN